MASDTPWSNFSQSDYSPQQWASACLIDRGSQVSGKARYSLPVKEPSGAYNINGIEAAAGAHGVSAVQGVSPAIKQGAARKLVSLYRSQVKKPPPPSLLRAAGMAASASAEKLAASAGK